MEHRDTLLGVFERVDWMFPHLTALCSKRCKLALMNEHIDDILKETTDREARKRYTTD
jgi:hypothetical protein